MAAVFATGKKALRDPVLGRQLRSFVAIGIACTVAFAALYSLLRGLGVAPLAANAVALLATMGANFAANRHLTFDAADGPVLRQLAQYTGAYVLGLGVSSLILAGGLALLGHPRGILDTALALTAGIGATVVRFALMRTWVFEGAVPGPDGVRA
ncbi:MAG TPA: GtrA family protein [Solirubrobacterales bacterium]|nr:GtrA family protein [Solirubrobacterales bacterium]